MTTLDERQVEGLTGIEPALSAWEAEVLPLNYSPVRPEAPGKPSKTGSLPFDGAGAQSVDGGGLPGPCGGAGGCPGCGGWPPGYPPPG